MRETTRSKFNTLKFKMKRMKYWKEGFDDRKKGANFSMTPYPALSNTSYSHDNQRTQRLYWSKGYWAANHS